ncbi:beta-lactamase family protein [Ectobacillus sp. JY-23]|uniref:serine hydrolase domain-containing protein n=1 Tax=Ectobacillus sp. JY-23 TaxID=2933872 RepID=UPI001FF5BA40|nr:serine hydrolase domain-containing protein [Ectobacillus sp. JY-23]UOY93833.1 beta-lactamase family protein [Ectobacillus sp. JY-23]
MNKKIKIGMAAILFAMAGCFGIKLDSNEQEKRQSSLIPITQAASVDDLTNKLDTYLQQANFNGTVLVIKDGITVLEKAYGFADFEKKVPNTVQTKYQIGSITKTTVAIAILQLYEQGKVNLNENVHTYIPIFPVEKNITLYQLLTHTSGIPEMGVGKTHAGVKVREHQKVAEWIGKQPLNFAAGTGWTYSDRNYMVLTHIIESITGMAFPEYAAKYIFTPVEMTSSGFGTWKDDVNISKGYRKTDNGIVPAPISSMDWLFGCGDMYTTVQDMKKLDEGIIKGVLLKPESVQLMFTPSAYKQYGFGFHISPAFYHNHGVISGWTTFNNISTQKNSYVILFSNVQSSIGDPFNEQFRDMVSHKN